MEKTSTAQIAHFSPRLSNIRQDILAVLSAIFAIFSPPSLSKTSFVCVFRSVFY